jgi:hypothetical protein
MLPLILWYLNLAFLPASLLAAAILGGRDERMTVGFILLAIIGTHFALSGMGERYHAAELRVLAVDALLAVALIALALRSDRFWPIWAASFHLLAVYTHLSILLAERIAPLPYGIIAGTWAFPTQGALLIGAWGHYRRSRRV